MGQTGAFLAALPLGAAGPVAALAGLPPIATIATLDGDWLRTTGMLLAVAGIAATPAAQLHIGTSRRFGVNPAEHTAVITDGAFAVARNPVFAATTIASLGLAAMVPNPTSLAATVVLIASIHLQVRAVESPTSSAPTARPTPPESDASFPASAAAPTLDQLPNTLSWG